MPPPECLKIRPQWSAFIWTESKLSISYQICIAPILFLWGPEYQYPSRGSRIPQKCQGRCVSFQGIVLIHRHNYDYTCGISSFEEQAFSSLPLSTKIRHTREKTNSLAASERSNTPDSEKIRTKTQGKREGYKGNKPSSLPSFTKGQTKKQQNKNKQTKKKITVNASIGGYRHGMPIWNKRMSLVASLSIEGQTHLPLAKKKQTKKKLAAFIYGRSDKPSYLWERKKRRREEKKRERKQNKTNKTKENKKKQKNHR